MLAATELPEFLWEPAIEQAAYVQNRSYTTPKGDKTPFQLWFRRKPDISHL